MKKLLQITLICLLLAACSRTSPTTATPSATAAVPPEGTSAVEGLQGALSETPPAAGETPTAAPTQTASLTPLPSSTPTEAPTGTPTQVSGAGRTGSSLANVTYCSPGGVPLLLDLYFPPNDSDPDPVVVHVHGGGFTGGDKAAGAGIPEIAPLVDAGFVVASINYRLAPTFLFPAQLYDLQCAMRFLRANAVFYNLDPQNIGVYGSSAGAYLTSMLGLTQPGDGFDEPGEYAGFSSATQAVVSVFGISKLIVENSSSPDSVWGVLTAESALRFSPATYATANDPPVLLMHGDQDRQVPLVQSQFLYDALTDAGGQVTFIVVQNGMHGFEAGRGEMIPSRGEITRIIVQFFVQHLQ